jgi:multiple sugar transport system ATP-binding protein
MAEVRFDNVSKVYEGGIRAVNNVSLTVEDGSLLVLVGPSGCGKSTTLRMVAGLEQITDGDIYIGDRRVNDVQPKDRDIAMVFQNYALYPHMTVFNNMAFGLKLRKYPADEIQKRVQDAASLLEIEPLLNRRPRELSGGQAQRVAVGRAIVRHPQVFLFDEPLSNLDAKLRVQMRVEIARLHERLGATMIYVTHDQVEAMTLGDRVAVMKDGDIHQVDTPLGLYNRPINRFVGGFIGSPPMNFLEGNLKLAEGGSWFSVSGLRLRLPEEVAAEVQGNAGKPVYLGIRPEDIHDSAFSPLPDPGQAQSLCVEVVEPLGAETLVYLRKESMKQYIIARLDSRSAPKVGSDLQVVFDMRRSHVFDHGTEKSLTYHLEYAHN